MMTATTGGLYSRDNLALYRSQRYAQSRANNQDFYFGPLSLLLFGAASFLYELMPNGNHGYAPDLETIATFFGTSQNAAGQWVFDNNERIPDNWTNRVAPYTSTDVTLEIVAM